MSTKMKTVELITTGTEISTGEVPNSNAQWLAQNCVELGLHVTRHTTVGDDAAAIGAACREAHARRADAVIVTGGLGGTSDDITLAAFGQAFGKPLVLHAELWDNIQATLARRGRPCTPNNRRMAELPEGAVALRNPLGIALGVRIAVTDTTFFFLPGVPGEMERVFTESIIPWFREAAWGTARGVRKLRCFGLPEAAIGHRIEALPLPAGIEVGYRVTFPETLIKLIAQNPDAQHVKDSLDAAEDTVRAALGAVVYGSGDETLPGVVGQLLAARHATCAVAESCTGGLVSHLITNVAGASQYFIQGVVGYSNDAKQDLLGVPAALITAHGAVSAEVATAMAGHVRTTAGTTYGLAVTGIAGPTGATPEKPLGTVYCALATPQATTLQHLVYPHERVAFKTFVAYTLLDMLRHELLKDRQ